jgi:hypothetical protein
MRRRAVLAAAGLAGTLVALSAAQPGPAEPGQPHLVVLLVVDQMRADYVPAFQADWTRGLRRLVDEGAWFTNAAYPYAQTLTCPGHATIATGTFPSQHGIVGNTWLERSTGRRVACTDDPNVVAVRYGGSAGGGHSASRLLAPTLGEHMRRLHRARVVALSIKARSAIMLAGRQADAVTWLSDSLDGWQTSTAFASRPLPVVKAFLDANPIDAEHGKTWMRLLPVARYGGQDLAAGEVPPPGWTAAFPHQLSGGGRPDRRFRVQWVHSPFADAYLGRFAADLVRTMRLGQTSGTDVLAVSFSAPDAAGHAFGPRSHEVHDILAQLDRTIGLLLDRLDVLVGRERYVVALTSDHGVDERPPPRHVFQVGPASRLAANHGTASESDRRVPVILAGVGIRPGQYEEPITPADIAPTLAALSGSTMPGVEGRVLQVALLGNRPPERPRSR